MIKLSSQTQKTQQASAAAYGVGMPTSDGGLGAVSRSLKTVAGSSAHIGNVVRTRKAQIQKSVGDRVASRMGQEMDKQTTAIDTAVQLGQWDKVNELRGNLTEWLGSVDPNAPDFRAVDKDPELTPDTSSRILESLNSAYSGYDLKLQSKVTLGQSLAEITNIHEPASASLKNITTKLSRGEDVMSGDFVNIVNVHKLAFENPVMQGGSSPVLNEGASKIRDNQLTGFIDLFVMGQSRSGNIHNTKASIDSLVTQLDGNKELYGEDALKYATKNLLKLQKEIGQPDSAAVAALESKYAEVANRLSTGSLPTSEDREEDVNLFSQLLDVDEPKARLVHLYSKLGAPDILSEAVSWIQDNPDSSPIEFFDDSESLKNFYNKGSFDSGQLTKLSNFITKLGEKHAENTSLYGSWGSVLTEQPDLAKSAAEHTQHLKQIMSGSDYAEQGSEWLSKTFNQGPTPAGTDRTMFEGAHLINNLLGEDATPEDVIKVSDMFTQFWGPEKMTDFAAYAHGLDNEDLQFVGLVAESKRRSAADPTILADRLKLGIETSSESNQKKLLGSKSSLFSESIRGIHNYETSYSFAKQVTDAADTGGLRATSLFLQSYIRGIAAQHVLANPAALPEDVSRVVDKTLSQDMTVVRDSSGESQVIWNRSNKQDYIGTPWNYLDFFNKGRITKEEHADVRSYNAFSMVADSGVDITELLSNYGEANDTALTEKLQEFVSPDDQFNFLITGDISGKKILRLNPMVTSKGGSDVRSIQVWSSKYNQYQNLTDKHGSVVSVDENQLEALSTNEKVKEMNFIRNFDRFEVDKETHRTKVFNKEEKLKIFEEKERWKSSTESQMRLTKELLINNTWRSPNTSGEGTDYILTPPLQIK